MWLPAVAVHLPGSGITPFNVWDLELMWWRIFRARAKEIADDITKQSKARATGGRN